MPFLGSAKNAKNPRKIKENPVPQWVRDLAQKEGFEPSLKICNPLCPNEFKNMRVNFG